MPKIEALQEMQRQFNKERGKFTIPVLWVDDDGVDEKKLKLFSRAGNFQVTVLRRADYAQKEWAEGKYAALVVDHRLGFHHTGDEIVRAVMETGIDPAMIAVVTTYLSDSYLANYAPWVTKDQVFEKDKPYETIARQFRQQVEDSLTADGEYPTQLNALDSIKPVRPSSP